MRFSYNWLQSYFEQPLPKVEEIAERLTAHSFEVDDIENLEKDTVFSIDILPNRAHDCFCHLGIAREISAVFNIPLKDDPLSQSEPQWQQTQRIIIDNKDAQACPRYSALLISGVKVGASPDWLKERLSALGQRSINNIVDIANYVMWSVGQPLHAFDLGKFTIKDGLVAIKVRNAEDGEKIIALDDQEYSLDNSDLVITDGNSGRALAVAGVKGGASSGVSEQTETIILESANFDPVRIRRTALRLGLRTDASARFEHGVSPELTPYAFAYAVDLIKEFAATNSFVVDGINDNYSNRQNKELITVSIEDVAKTLGVQITHEKASEALTRLGFKVESGDTEITVERPMTRLDIEIPEDIIEEIGRIEGYSDLELKEIKSGKGSIINKKQYYINEARNILSTAGLSEVYTYTFVDKGDVEIAKPLASDKGFMRPSLEQGLIKSLALNTKNADVLGLDSIAIFEVGTVFPKEGEKTSLGIGIRVVKKSGEYSLLENLKSLEWSPLVEALAISLGDDYKYGVVEIDFDHLISTLPEPKKYDWRKELKPVKFEKISPFPHILRDVSVWVPAGTKREELAKVIQENTIGKSLFLLRLVDTYEKDDHVSYSFRLIFQAKDRTLTDEEVNLTMWHIEAELKNVGWEVR